MADRIPSSAIASPATRRTRCLAVFASVFLAAALAGAEVPDPALGSSDPAAVAARVAELERAPRDTPDLADAWFEAARACRDILRDPARAYALYQRIAKDFPDARVAVAARRWIDILREQVGDRGEFAGFAAELAALQAAADRIELDAVIGRALALSEANWPGAATARLWLADWLRRTGRLDAAQDHYAQTAARWPNTPEATLALRGGAGCALDRKAWDLAEQIALQLPGDDPADRIVRDRLLADARTKRVRHLWLYLAWGSVFGSAALMLASFVEAALRRPRRWSLVLLPFEVRFMAPIAAVLVAVALTTNEMIAPAVITVSLGGLGMTWISGIGLDLMRGQSRPVAVRAIIHVLLVALMVGALGYIVLMRDDLIDMVVQTMRVGPER